MLKFHVIVHVVSTMAMYWRYGCDKKVHFLWLPLSTGEGSTLPWLLCHCGTVHCAFQSLMIGIETKLLASKTDSLYCLLFFKCISWWKNMKCP